MRSWRKALVAFLPVIFTLSHGTVLFTEGSVYSQDAATVRIAPTRESIHKGEELIVEVSADGVTNLGGFQLVLTFEDNRLDFKSAEPGDWLSSSGREMVCPDPTAESSAVLLRCVTLREEPAGVAGSGVLYRVTFVAKSTGTSVVGASRVRLLHPDASDLSPDIKVDPGEISILNDGTDGLFSHKWIILIGAFLGLGALIGVIRMLVGRRQSAPREIA